MLYGHRTLNRYGIPILIPRMTKNLKITTFKNSSKNVEPTGQTFSSDLLVCIADGVKVHSKVL